MLETRVLLLHPNSAGRPRPLADAVTGKPLGFARWQPDVERRWLASLLGPVLSVHEVDEEPLVFTVRRCLLWTQREVRDAESERVGYVSERAVRDRNRLLYARLRLESKGIVYECVNGASLATTTRTSDGLELSFAPTVEHDPFAKMLLLAGGVSEE